MSAMEKAAKLVGALSIERRPYGGRQRWAVEFPGVVTPSRMQAWTDNDLCGALLDAMAARQWVRLASVCTDKPDGQFCGWLAVTATVTVSGPTRLDALCALVNSLPGGEG